MKCEHENIGNGSIQGNFINWKHKINESTKVQTLARYFCGSRVQVRANYICALHNAQGLEL